MRLRRVAAVALLIALAACSSSTKNDKASSSSSSASGTSSTTTTAPAPTSPVGHVFIINLENKGFEETWGAGSPATFLNGTLRPKGQLLTQYYGTAHFSLGNYIAQISGQGPNADTQADCTTYKEFVSTGTGDLGQELGAGCVYPANVKTIADQLTSAGKTWRAYQEDIGNSATEPKTCRHPVIGEGDTTLAARQGDMYATRHNPFMYFHSI